MPGAEKGRGWFADFQYNPFHSVSFVNQYALLFARSFIFEMEGIRFLYLISVAETSHHKLGD